MAREQQIGGGTNSRPLDDTIDETGPGIPDEAIGPGQMPVEDLSEVAADADRAAEKPASEIFGGQTS